MTDCMNIAVLGSTGSVGTQTLDVVRAMPDRYRVVSLAGNSNWRELARQVQEFDPAVVSVCDPAGAEALRNELNGSGVRVLQGPDGLAALAGADNVDTVVSAVAGAAGLPAAIAALEAGKRLALANKEPVVMCGHLLKKAEVEGGGTLLPVDSEHSAVFQLLQGVRPDEVTRVILTASGGPFRGRRLDELAQVTPEEALAHPTYRMGQKITIDSATLMNKALEVIEARWLFNLSAEEIGVFVHPQSIVHSLVELTDGSMLAHMGMPDMRLPIQYALGYPERHPCGAGRLDITTLSKLEFLEPDWDAFPALRLGFQVARENGLAGTVLSAANEVAVQAFLDGEIAFTDIVAVVNCVLDRHDAIDEPDLGSVLEADRWAREEARKCL